MGRGDYPNLYVYELLVHLAITDSFKENSCENSIEMHLMITMYTYFNKNRQRLLIRSAEG